MHDAERVRTAQGIQYLSDHGDGRGRRESARLGQHLAEVTAVNILHRKEWIALVHGEIVDRDDIRVCTAAGGPCLMLEAFEIVRLLLTAEQIRADQLDRDL